MGGEDAHNSKPNHAGYLDSVEARLVYYQGLCVSQRGDPGRKGQWSFQAGCYLNSTMEIYQYSE